MLNPATLFSSGLRPVVETVCFRTPHCLHEIGVDLSDLGQVSRCLQIWGRFTRNLHSQVFLGPCGFGCLQTITCLSHTSATCCGAQPFLWILWTTLTHPATHAHRHFGISSVYLVGPCERQHRRGPHLPPRLPVAVLNSFLPGCPRRAQFFGDFGASFSSGLDPGNWEGRGAPSTLKN